MKSLADIKRRFRPNVVLECVENTKRPELNGTRRRVTDVQGNAYVWRAEGAEAESQRSWSYWPPARGIEYVDADTVKMPITNAWGKVEPEHFITLRVLGRM